MKKIILLISIIILQLGCSKSNNEEETNKISYPECLNTKIQEVLQNSPRIPRSNIKKYNYQGKAVYMVLINGIADEQHTVYDGNCNLICSVGGIGGNSSDTCINWENATYIETVWTDPR